MSNSNGQPPSEHNGKRRRTEENLKDITDFRKYAFVDEIDTKVYDLALDCNLEEDQLARMLFETYTDRVLQDLEFAVSCCDKPNGTTEESQSNTSEDMEHKKKEVLNYYGFLDRSELKKLVDAPTQSNNTEKISLKPCTVLSFTKPASTRQMRPTSRAGNSKTRIRKNLFIMSTCS